VKISYNMSHSLTLAVFEHLMKSTLLTDTPRTLTVYQCTIVPTFQKSTVLLRNVRVFVEVWIKKKKKKTVFLRPEAINIYSF
jgi:hypothetical protein